MRHGQCQRAARERHAIGDQTCADLGEQPVGAWGVSLAASTSQASVEESFMEPIIGLTRLPCHALFSRAPALALPSAPATIKRGSDD